MDVEDDADQNDVAATDDQKLKRAIRDEAKRLIIDCTYTARGHQSAGQFWASVNSWLGLPAAIASALIAVGAAANAIVGQNPLLTAGLAMLSAVLTSVHAFFHPDELAEEHGLKGDRFISLRNDTRMFLEIDLLTLASTEWPAKLHDLRQRYNALNESAPRRIVRRDYNAARQSIAAGESNYENDPLWKELGE